MRASDHDPLIGAELDLGGACRDADAVERRAAVRMDAEEGGAGGFGEAVVLDDDGGREQRLQALFLGARHRLAADLDPFHRAGVGRDGVRRGQHQPPERGHRGDGVDLAGLEHGGDLDGVKAAWGDVPGPAGGADGPATADAEGVVDRHADIFAHRGVQAHDSRQPLGGVGDVGVGEGDALGLAGGAGGEENLGDSVIVGRRVGQAAPAGASGRCDDAGDAGRRDAGVVALTAQGHGDLAGGLGGEAGLDEGRRIDGDQAHDLAGDQAGARRCGGVQGHRRAGLRRTAACEPAGHAGWPSPHGACARR